MGNNRKQLALTTAHMAALRKHRKQLAIMRSIMALSVASGMIWILWTIHGCN